MKSFYSEIESEDEIYSYKQLEAFNSLSQNDQRRIKDTSNDEHNNIKEELDSVNTENIPSDHTVLPPSILVVQKPIDTHAIKRIIPLKKNITERKGNPKTVTASVFKAISPDVKLLKTIPQTRHMNGADAQKSRSVTNNLLKTVSSARREGLSAVNENRIPQVINQPNIPIAQKVVTASLIHPRKEASLQKTTGAAAVAAAATVAAAAPQQTMNKTFFMFSDNAPQLCREYPGRG